MAKIIEPERQDNQEENEKQLEMFAEEQQ